MDKKTIILVIAIFSFLIAGMFGFAYLKNKEIIAESAVVETETNEDQYSTITRVDAKHYFEDRLHTFVGEVILPTPCDLLQAETSVMKSLPEKIVISFSIINNSNDCELKDTTQRFSVTAVASDQAEVSAIFMGRPVELNLVPAAPGESPEEFELFIKG